MAPCGKVELIEKKDRRFDAMLKEVFQSSNFEGQCTGEKGLVNLSYARRYMKSRATVIAFVSRDACTKRGGCFCGFGLGYTKFVEELSASVFYIDLVCSQERMGRDLLLSLEAYGARSGAKVAALRASIPELVPVYEKRGYYRLADACTPPSRAGRMALRELNKYAGSVGPKGEGGYTDGVRWANGPADAWRLAKQARPARAPPSSLPSGWRFEEGEHGWWMSKCLV